MTDHPHPGDHWTAPSGVTFRILTIDNNTVTVDLHRLADGTPATLTNHQEYSTTELVELDGWRKNE